MASVAQINRHRISDGDSWAILGGTENKMNCLVSVFVNNAGDSL